MFQFVFCFCFCFGVAPRRRLIGAPDNQSELQCREAESEVCHIQGDPSNVYGNLLVVSAACQTISKLKPLIGSAWFSSLLCLFPLSLSGSNSTNLRCNCNLPQWWVDGFPLQLSSVDSRLHAWPTFVYLFGHLSLSLSLSLVVVGVIF